MRRIPKLRLLRMLLAYSLLLLASPLSQAAEAITYYHLDALGSPVAATDEQGQLLWKEAYRPYGDRYRQEDGGTNDLWYTGKPRDVVTGLDYFGARWYDPTIGRFMGIDPAPIDPENIHSVNRYAYANNNPYRYVDPDGENAVTALGGLIHETGQFLSGNGFNGSMVMGALADGYNGEGGGFANAAINDAMMFIPAGAGAVAGGLVKISSHLTKGTKGTNPAISTQKQAGHIPGTPQNANRLKQGKPTSSFFGEKSGERFTQQAFEKGNSVPGRPNIREHDFGVSTGTGPNGGMQSRVRVHQDSKGRIHGHPSGPERF